MNKEEKRRFLRNLDITKTTFQCKVADFGFSKQVSE